MAAVSAAIVGAAPLSDNGYKVGLVQTLVRRTLAKKPEDRPESMAEFLREMRTMEVFKVPPAAVR